MLQNELTTPASYFMKEDQAAQQVAARLVRGQTALVLGTGVSTDAALPSWVELVRKCCDEKNVPCSIDPDTPEVYSGKQLFQIMEEVREALRTDGFEDESLEEEYKDLVKRILYSGVDKSESWLKKRSLMLVALGTLLMGVRSGKIFDVVNYSFDSVLEDYLAYHGVTSQSVVDLPCLIGDADVRIYHPYGFLPNDGEIPSQRLVLDESSYLQRVTRVDGTDSMWHSTIINLLLTKQPVFIGLSERDDLIPPVLFEAHQRISENPARDRDIVGFWVFSKEPDSDLVKSMKRTWKCIPVVLDGYDAIPEWLLKIRRYAALA